MVHKTWTYTLSVNRRGREGLGLPMRIRPSCFDPVMPTFLTVRAMNQNRVAWRSILIWIIFRLVLEVGAFLLPRGM
jgi:hypothetical protein